MPDVQEFIIGIRPKNIILKEKREPGYLKGHVHTFENLGDYTLSSVRLDTGDLIFIIGDVNMRLSLDVEVFIALNPDKVVFYDNKTTNLINKQNNSRVS